jgi:hypothetical protein
MSAKSRTHFDRGLVKLAIQIEADSLMRELAEKSPATFAKKQIHNIENKVSRLSFVLKVFGILALLLCFVGGMVVGNVVKSIPTIDPCRRSVIGDGVCDDHQNTAKCEYDGMDCCLLTMVTKYCDDCKCHLGMQ